MINVASAILVMQITAQKWTQMILQLNTKPYCNCVSAGRAQKQDGFALDVPTGIWVCTRCRKPSRMNFERHLNGKPQIPQPRTADDIYWIELRLEAKRIIETEFNWRELVEEMNDEDLWWESFYDN